MRHQLRRAAAIAAVAAPVLALCTVLPAWAGDGGIDGGNTTTPEPPPGKSDSGSISAHVQTTTSYHGSGGTPLTSSDVNWAPPPCWYEPRFTPEQYETYYRNEMKGWSTGKQYIKADLDKLEQEHYNKGKDGLWWQRVLNESLPSQYTLDNCTLQAPEVWVPTGDPRPVPGVLTPEELSQIAYAATKLPAPPVTLSPVADGQIVNLPTYVKFGSPLDRVWVTASIAVQGVNIAATTVATPVSLRVDAGTQDASPQSCTYDLTKSDGGYKVDTASSGCNITYRKVGSHQLHAQITWRVTWIPSADPNGLAGAPGLPDGLSTYDQPVTVKEIQTVVR